MKFHLRIFYCASLIGMTFIACQPSKSDKDVIRQATQNLDIQKYIDTTSVQYVILENTPKCIVGTVVQLAITDSCIFIVNYQPRAIYMFAHDGEYIRQIGKQGRGPWEYLSIENIDVDESKKEIVLYDGQTCRALRYNYNGDFLASFECNTHPYGEIIKLNDTLYALQNNFNNPDIPQNPKILIINDTGKIINSFIQRPKDVDKESDVPTSSGFFTKNKLNVYYIPYGEDKLYKLSPDGQKNEAILSLGIQAYMMPMNLTWEEFERIKKIKLGPLGGLCITDEGTFATGLNFDNKDVQYIGNLKDGVQLVGWPSALSSAWPGLITPQTTYRDCFVGIKSAAEAIQCKDKFPNLAEDANPIIVFFKYKLPKDV